MISQTWIIGKAIRALFTDRVTYTDSEVSVDLSIWNIIILLSFKLSVKHQ